MTPKQEAALRLAREALKLIDEAMPFPVAKFAQAAIDEALAEQPAQQGVDWEKLYRLAVKSKEALAAKYERDTGKKLTRIVPMAEQPEQPDMNLNCKSVQARLATSWGYVKAEQPAQQQTDERIDALRTLDYCHGLKAGWNFCAADDDAGFERAMAGTSEAVRILKTQPAQQQEPFGYFRYDLRLDAWVQNRAGLTGTPFYTSPPASKQEPNK